MFRRLIVVAVAAVVVLAAPAAAQYAPDSTITIDGGPAVVPGESISVSGSCFQPGTTVTLLLDGSALATGTAGSDGTVTVTGNLPASLTGGNHQVVLQGTDCDGVLQSLTSTVTYTIPGQNPDPEDDLPIAGSDSTGVLTAGAAAMIGAGGLLVLAGRKRSTASAES